MKTHTKRGILAILIAAVLSIQLTAQNQAETHGKQSRYLVKELSAPASYRIIALPGLGGTQARSNSINNRGWATGWSNLAGDMVQHAALWREDEDDVVDLGTLGGLNSVLEWTIKNEHGLIVGGAETGEPDPYGENFCLLAFPVGLCRAFLWKNGQMTVLPTLGGPNAYGISINTSGLVVGWSELAGVDPKCLAPQAYNWHGFAYQAQQEEGEHRDREGTIRDLPPLPGDAMSAALGVNDLGQIVGTSGICANANTIGYGVTRHAVLWEPDGTVINLGNLGGVVGNPNNFLGGFAGTDINNRGQVCGLSDLTGDLTTHAFLWENGVMTDLGTLPGDFYSFAWGMGEEGQVLGHSCDVNVNCRGFIWQNGVMADVNSLLPAGNKLYVEDANFINAAGEISGDAIDLVTGNMVAIRLIPCKGTNEADCNVEAQGDVRVELSQHQRDAIRRKLLGFAHR